VPGPETAPAPTSAALLTVLVRLATAPPADEAGDWFGLAPGAAPVLWPPPWPGMMSSVTAWTAEAAALVAEEAGGWCAPLLDPVGGAGTLAAGTFAAGTLAAGMA
jgi:hypothetical protein